MMKRNLLVAMVIFVLSLSTIVIATPPSMMNRLAADLPVTAAPGGVGVYFITPQDGEIVPVGFTVRFGLRGMGVAPAGVGKENTGHHHLLIDVDQLPPAGLPVPNDEHHRHFGGGQTEAVITLPPGKHTLQLELGDANHMPFDPPLLSKKITVVVK